MKQRFIRKRKVIRVGARDYAEAAAYFITIRIERGAPVLARIEGGRVTLSGLGRIVDESWRAIPKHFPGWDIDAYVVMPDHFHGIVYGVDPGRRRGRAGESPARTWTAGEPTEPTKEYEVKRPTLGILIGQFKSFVSKIAWDQVYVPPGMLWQRGYHERVIRSGTVDAYRRYIAMNPVRWKKSKPFLTQDQADRVGIDRASGQPTPRLSV